MFPFFMDEDLIFILQGGIIADIIIIFFSTTEEKDLWQNALEK